MDCAVQTNRTKPQTLHALNRYYFETMLMLIVLLWLLKWLFAAFPAISMAQEETIQ